VCAVAARVEPCPRWLPGRPSSPSTTPNTARHTNRTFSLAHEPFRAQLFSWAASNAPGSAYIVVIGSRIERSCRKSARPRENSMSGDTFHFASAAHLAITKVAGRRVPTLARNFKIRDKKFIRKSIWHRYRGISHPPSHQLFVSNRALVSRVIRWRPATVASVSKPCVRVAETHDLALTTQPTWLDLRTECNSNAPDRIPHAHKQNVFLIKRFIHS